MIIKQASKQASNQAINQVDRPFIDKASFISENRQEGLSGYMRLRNEAEFLPICIESWLPILDELIIVYNNCQDNTAEIVSYYAEKYPEKITAYHYIPIVYPQGSSQFKQLSEDNYHSLVNYYNFALSKTTKKWVIKIDGDLYLPPEKVDCLRNLYHYLKENDINGFIPIGGVNILDHQGEMYVASNSKFCGINGDLCLIRVDSDTFFFKGENTEMLAMTERTRYNSIFAYYHLKFMKADYGVGNYELLQNRASVYLPKTLAFLSCLKLIPLDEILIETNMPKIDLTNFNINRNRDYFNDVSQYMENILGFSINAFKQELHYFSGGTL